MNKPTFLPDRALGLLDQAGDGIKRMMPAGAGKWLEAGAALGLARTGVRTAGRLVRRNPAIAIATAAGAGLLWYAARRRAKQSRNGNTIEGRATRVEAKKPAKRASRPRKPRARKATPGKTG